MSEFTEAIENWNNTDEEFARIFRCIPNKNLRAVMDRLNVSEELINRWSARSVNPTPEEQKAIVQLLIS